MSRCAHDHIAGSLARRWLRGGAGGLSELEEVCEIMPACRDQLSGRETNAFR